MTIIGAYINNGILMKNYWCLLIKKKSG